MTSKPDETSDRDLVRRCIAGEERGWEEFVSRFHPLLDRNARAQLRRVGFPADPSSVDEICARVYETLLNRNCASLHRFSGASPMSAWLIGIVRNKTLQYVSEIVRRREVSGERPEEGEAGGVGIPLTAAVREVLSDLSETDRRALEALYWDGLTYEEAARRENVPFGTFAARVSRLKKILVSRFKGLFSILL